MGQASKQMQALTALKTIQRHEQEAIQALTIELDNKQKAYANSESQTLANAIKMNEEKLRKLGIHIEEEVSSSTPTRPKSYETDDIRIAQELVKNLRQERNTLITKINDLYVLESNEVVQALQAKLAAQQTLIQTLQPSIELSKPTSKTTTAEIVKPTPTPTVSTDQKPTGARAALLDAIQAGTKLKKVQPSTQPQQNPIQSSNQSSDLSSVLSAGLQQRQPRVDDDDEDDDIEEGFEDYNTQRQQKEREHASALKSSLSALRNDQNEAEKIVLGATSQNIAARVTKINESAQTLKPKVPAAAPPVEAGPVLETPVGEIPEAPLFDLPPQKIGEQAAAPQQKEQQTVTEKATEKAGEPLTAKQPEVVVVKAAEIAHPAQTQTPTMGEKTAEPGTPILRSYSVNRKTLSEMATPATDAKPAASISTVSPATEKQGVVEADSEKAKLQQIAQTLKSATDKYIQEQKLNQIDPKKLKPQHGKLTANKNSIAFHAIERQKALEKMIADLQDPNKNVEEIRKRLQDVITQGITDDKTDHGRFSRARRIRAMLNTAQQKLAEAKPKTTAAPKL